MQYASPKHNQWFSACLDLKSAVNRRYYKGVPQSQFTELLTMPLKGEENLCGKYKELLTCTALLSVINSLAKCSYNVTYDVVDKAYTFIFKLSQKKCILEQFEM